MLHKTVLNMRIKKSFAILFLILTLFLFLLPACAVNPVSGSHEIMLYSTDQEVAMGRKAHPQVLKEFGYYDNRKVQAYVAAVGNRVGRHCERRDITYHFTVIDSPIVNAFALPGGYVYVSRGLLAECNNEAQLAGVLGHELGHVNARHNMKRLQSAVGMNILVAAVGAATGSSLWQNVSGQIMGLLSQKYSRSQEREADKLGTRYMTLAGYDPRQMSAFLQRLRELHSHEPSGLEAIMASHPLTSERVASTAALATQLLQRYPRAKDTGRNRYLSAIDGMLYGPGEKAGFVIGRLYTNVFCRLQCTIPTDMQLQTFKKGFILLSEHRQQFVFLYRQLNHFLPPDTLADSFMDKYAARLQTEEDLTLDQARGIRRRYRVQDKNGHWQQITLTSLSRPKFGYLFLGLTPRTQKTGFINRHVSLLSKEAADAIVLPTIKIYRVRAGDTLEGVAKRFLASAEEAESLADYNGLKGKFGVRQQLPVDMQLKVIPGYPKDSRDSSSISRQPSSIMASVLPKTLRSGS